MHLKPKKSLGQNFLRSQKAILDILNSLESSHRKVKKIIEIGGGEGVLTQALLDRGYKVKVIELDHRAQEILKDKCENYIENGQCEIINADVLKIDLGNLFSGEYKVVGNIPYYITGLIFRHVFAQKILPSSATFMVQKEVAERVVTKNGKNSLLSLSVKFYGTPKLISVVKAGSFVPKPKVDSAILHIGEIKVRDKKLTKLESKFFELIHLAFRHPRKYALSNIKKYFSTTSLNNIQRIEKYFLDNNLQKQRPEDIGLHTWLEIIDYHNL